MSVGGRATRLHTVVFGHKQKLLEAPRTKAHIGEVNWNTDQMRNGFRSQKLEYNQCTSEETEERIEGKLID